MTAERFGLSCALLTPFREDGSVDSGRLAGHAKNLLGRGCGSVTLFGTTGEGSAIGAGERTATLRALLEAGIAPERIVGGVVATAVDDAAAQASAYLAAGAKAVLVPPPFYVKGPSDEGIFGWYAALFDALGSASRDAILYNIPPVTAVTLSVDLVERLKRAYPTSVIGVKDSSGDWPYTERLLAAHRDLTILVGDERHLAQGVRLGGQGAISGLANLVPEKLLPLAHEGREDPQVAALVELVVAHPVTPAIKALMAARSGDRAWARVRPPFEAIPAQDAEALRQEAAPYWG